jgi:hypothetical protein
MIRLKIGRYSGIQVFRYSGIQETIVKACYWYQVLERRKGRKKRKRRRIKQGESPHSMHRAN